MRPDTKALILSGGGARGAYHVGVWKFLQECGWNPDIVCGTSVGAVNAAAIGAGLDVQTMEMIWKEMDRKHVFHLRSFGELLFKMKNKSYTPLLNSLPLEQYISRTIDFNKLRKSPYEIYISAVSVQDSTLHFFNKKQISIDHILASSAIPVLFPWRWIQKRPFWDGGVMMNTPLLPALRKGASDIIVVLPSPVGGRVQEIPSGKQQVLERAFEQVLAASFQVTLSCMDLKISRRKIPGKPHIRVISPDRMMGFQSILDFSSSKTAQFAEEGYKNARESLGKNFNRKSGSASPGKKKAAKKRR
ncbi:MAG: patatin-like phospholipase family protein [Spirochaetia bacterium]|nr:patatin-like phospholipase family protein [Spirochaetia bacterium]